MTPVEVKTSKMITTQITYRVDGKNVLRAVLDGLGLSNIPVHLMTVNWDADDFGCLKEVIITTTTQTHEADE